MSERRVRIEEVLIYLGATETRFIAELREVGLFEADELDADQAEELRVAQVLIEELGVNAPGVDVALHLRRRLLALERRTRALLAAMPVSEDEDVDDETRGRRTR